VGAGFLGVEQRYRQAESGWACGHEEACRFEDDRDARGVVGRCG
jgi:hypothetical protein